MSRYKTLLPIKHNGREYCVGDVIDELEPQYSKRLLEIRAVILLAESDGHAAAKSPSAHAKGSVEEPAASDFKTAESVPKDTGKNPPSHPVSPVPDKFKEYAEKTNKEQMAYIETIQDTEILIELKEYSKSNAKKLIEKKLKEAETETQEE